MTRIISPTQFMVLTMALTSFAALANEQMPTVNKQIGCKVHLINAQKLRKGGVYKIENDTFTARIKLTAKKGRRAKGRLLKRNCSKNYIGSRVVQNKRRKPNPAGSHQSPNHSNNSFSLSMNSGFFVLATLNFNSQTQLSIEGVNFQLLPTYNLNFERFSMPISAGVSSKSLSSKFSDRNGAIQLDGSTTSLALEIGVGPKIRSGLIGLSFHLGANIPISNSLETVFSSQNEDEAPRFPQDFQDADGKTLGQKLEGSTQVSLGYYARLEVAYKINNSWKAGIYGSYEMINHKTTLKAPQPFTRVSDSIKLENLESEGIKGYMCGLNLTTYF